MLEFLKINDKHYILDIRKLASVDECITTTSKESVKLQCSVFDLVQLWCETISVGDLVEREKKADSIIQYSSEIVNETILARKADDFSIHESDFNLCLKLKYYVSGIPVTFNLQLKIASREEISENIILPVWRTLLLLYEENCALKDVIIKKDIEIEQYKVEGAVLRRSLVATPKFDERKFADSFPLVIPEEGLKVRELIKSKDRRGNLMKLLRIRVKDAPEGVSPIKGKIASHAVTPTRKSPGGRAKGLEAIYAKQRIPKAISTSSLSLKRLQADQSDEDDKDDIVDARLTSLSSSSLNDTRMLNDSGKVKIRKITKL